MCIRDRCTAARTQISSTHTMFQPAGAFTLPECKEGVPGVLVVPRVLSLSQAKTEPCKHPE
eukprot:7859344-Prorocentrum_lima.AAC.1